MTILVCISYVPDTAAKIGVTPEGTGLVLDGVKYILNPYDEFAIEEALQQREKHGGKVIALTVGPESAKEILRTALAMGVDSATIIPSTSLDSFGVAYNIAAYARSIGADLILLGRQSIDHDSFQMASTVGAMLGIPSISVVSKLEIEGATVRAERDIEGGKEILTSSLPIVISVQKGINTPRYPKLPDIMKAKSKPIDTVEPQSVQPRVAMVRYATPQLKRRGIILGDSDADIAEFVRLLHEEAKVI
ncbi:MAG: electron transfer flavoprotein subunit beta/FixA family protein [Bacteroidota bacterium]|nr:electron transfer flavoprotein subunit beta/FixA family protein [Candidatus Kapabacteria bacterium]MCX7936330.1 electron transfer flavoprotein subunit beta/FixA family protein [Chlorobiota bacterium]MDW8074389.1 electron transfer flavoprotein subunit beta/FixA family protein [Bacteroidota bacterium]MDW8271135.1 electron transfer flavoprotein subunit beta/FixA family protein [Bacteroidota bacterium]